MHPEDYELAETYWQDLREGRSKKLDANDVQRIADRIVNATETVPLSMRTEIDTARDDAWVAACTLAGEMESHPEATVDWAWDKAISLAAEWFKAAE
jgi:hypothetical protein